MLSIRPMAQRHPELRGNDEELPVRMKTPGMGERESRGMGANRSSAAFSPIHPFIFCAFGAFVGQALSCYNPDEVKVVI